MGLLFCLESRTANLLPITATSRQQADSQRELFFHFVDDLFISMLTYYCLLSRMSSMNSGLKWVSIHIYYKNSYRSFLNNSLSPFIKEMLDKKYAIQFFFIHYIDKNGLHIRLRLRSKDEISYNELRTSIKNAFNKEQILFKHYKPELKRYGGKVGMEIAYNQFESSSEVVLNYFSLRKKLPFHNILGMALQMHLILLHHLNLNKKDMTNLLEHILLHRLNILKLDKTNEIPKYEKLLSDQYDLIMPYLQDIWKICELQKNFKSSLLNSWNKSSKKTNTALKKSQKMKQITINNVSSVHTPNSLSYLYESYIHMTNNRLGIYNNEAFLMYTLKRFFEINTS